VELLKQMAPAVRRKAVLRDPTVAADVGQFDAIQSAAQSLGIEIVPMSVCDPAELEREVALAVRHGARRESSATSPFKRRNALFCQMQVSADGSSLSTL
jgi:putative tryptophan/tyrosine transport system substrate-binding protein